jgi:hypothetical protein
VRRNAVDGTLLHAGFVYQANATLGKVTESTMQQAAGSAAGTKGEIVLFHQSSAQSAQGGIARDTRAHNATANDQDLQRFLGKLGKSLLSELVHGLK